MEVLARPTPPAFETHAEIQHDTMGPRTTPATNPANSLSIDTNMKCSTEFWDPNGNIIILARGSVFCISEERLGQQSMLFSRLFMIPRWQDVADKLADRPVIHLPDSPCELHLLFRMVFDTSLSLMRHSGSSESSSSPKFSDIAAVVRLAAKYEMTTICNKALAKLTSFCSVTFLDWENLEDYVAQASFGFELRDAITLVSIARITGVSAMLPLAFYMCSQLGDEMTDGFVRDGHKEELSMDDRIMCVSGKELLAKASKVAHLRIFCGNDVKTGRLFSCCKQAHSEALRQTLSPFNAGAQDELTNALDPQLDRIKNLHDFCPTCYETIRERELEGRRKLWEELPSFFGLGQEDWPTDCRNL